MMNIVTRDPFRTRRIVALRLLFLVLPMLCPALALHGQDLLIQYDYYTGDIGYYRFYIDGKTFQTTEFNVGYGNRVVVRVVNLNQNIYSVNSPSGPRPVTAERERTDLLDVIRSFNLLNIDASQGSPTLDRDNEEAPPSPRARRTRQRSTTRGQSPNIASAASLLMDRIATKERDFKAGLRKFRTLVRGTLQRAAPLAGLLESSAEVRHQSEAMLRKNVTDVLSGVLAESPQNKTAGYTVGDIMRYASDGYSTMREGYNDVEKLYQDVDAVWEEMMVLTQKYPAARGIRITADTSNGGLIPVGSWIGAAHRERARVEITAAGALLDAVEIAWTEYFQEVARLYGAVNDIPFVHQYEIRATGDNVPVNITILDRGTRTERDRGDAVRTIAERSFLVPVSGGWNLSAGIGMAGNYYFANQGTYSVVADTIQAFTNDRFTPGAIALLHIYRRTTGSISWGPSVGLGVALNKIHSINLMLGGSLHIGDAHRIVATLGLLGGQVTRLEPGYAIGSHVAGTTPPTQTGFDYGMFLGISYAVGNW